MVRRRWLLSPPAALTAFAIGTHPSADKAETVAKPFNSSDHGLPQEFRPPSYKPNLDSWQANFEERFTPSGAWQSNGHLDITDLP